MHERLDTAGPRREIIGDDQDLCHLGKIIAAPPERSRGRRYAASGELAAQGLAALSRFALYQPDSATFSTFEPVCGASIR